MAIGQRFTMGQGGSLEEEDKFSPLAKALRNKKAAGFAKGAGAAMGSESALGGALAGAGAGPIGVAGGAALGLARGIAAQQRKKRELKAQSIREQGANIKETAKEKNAALKSIMDGLKAAFLGI